MINEKTKVAVATGRSRKEIVWENKSLFWGELCAKLLTTKRTGETVAEYKALAKGAQDEIKDVGGFVGGKLHNGRRKNGFVESRSVLTLDVDFGTPELIGDLEMFSEYQVLIYSTHKHTPERPRVRLVIPLNREVSPEEYEAISRKVAEDIGIELFDDTTYEPGRLMYWPSTSSDGEFVGKLIDGPWLDADGVLARYSDWRDITLWPHSSKAEATRKGTAGKQGDPLEKPGVIGAFNQSYTIHEAILTFLPDVYLPGKIDGRYTYSKGSTSDGLVTYDDKFAYSNHGTDPAMGMLCSAFDLVRLHKFGHLDVDIKSDAAITAYPSYQAMKKWAAQDPKVKAIFIEDTKEARATALEDFGDIPIPDDAWMKKLTSNTLGFEATRQNVELILMNDPALKGKLGYNQFSGRPEVIGRLPWTRCVADGSWDDTDDANLRAYLERAYRLDTPGKINDSVLAVMARNAFNPVKEYIESAIWDGTKRVEPLFIDYLGADDCDYVRTVTRKTLVAAVSRIYKPGCKFDYMTTLVGAQGIGKSILINKLGNGWTSDTLTDIKGKEAYEALDGVWILEMSELVALKKQEREAIKSFISKVEDTYRKAFAHHTTVNKRTCIFIGTTNDDEFLNDSTGSRRFLVIDTHPGKRAKFSWDLTKEEVAQIWAEAYEYYLNGEDIMAMPEDVAIAARNAQQSHSEDSPLIGVIEEYLAIMLPPDWASKTIESRRQWISGTKEFRAAGIKSGDKMAERTRVAVLEVWCECMGKAPADIGFTDRVAIRNCLKSLPGWSAVQTPRKYGPYGNQRGFERNTAEKV